jgi:DNA polymerase-3 subunit epsilon
MSVGRLTGWLRGWLVARDETALDTLLDPGFVAIDVETTGLDPRRDAVVSLAAIPFVGGRPGAGLVSFVDPGRPVPAASTRIHGIEDRHVTGAPQLHEVVARVDELVGERIVVGHDVTFDLQFLARAKSRRRALGRSVVALDTRRLGVALHPGWKAASELETIAGRFDIPVVGRHTADGDARIAGLVFLALLPELRARGARTVGDLAWAQTAVFRRA